MKIRLNGPVIDDSEAWIYRIFGIEAIYPKKVIQQIERAESESNKDVTVMINSGGGSVFAASEIYTALRSYKGKLQIEIVGIAASAASVISMAGDSSISPTGQFMLHNASMGNQGDYRSMDQASKILKGVNASILNAYKAKTGKTDEEIAELMNEETWLTAKQAVDLGFVNRIMFDDDVADLGISASQDNGALPNAVIKKMKNMLAEGKILPTNESESQDGAPVGFIKEDFAELVAAAKAMGESTALGMKNAANVMEAFENDNEGDDEVNLETIKNDHPEIYEAIKNEGVKEGIKAENDRIKNIEELAYPGIEELVNSAKFENNSTAAELAIQIVKAEKAIGTNFLANRDNDAEKAGTVPAGQSGENQEEANSNENISALVAAMGGKRK